MIKELQLVARITYTLVIAFIFWGLTGFSLETCLMTAGVTTFPMSFLFQYFVLHFALKNTPAPRKRLVILIVWGVVAGAVLVLAMAMLPSLEDLGKYADVELFKHDFYTWATTYFVASAAFVALTCARRAWTRHGQLG